MVQLSQSLDDIVLTRGADCSGVFRPLPKSAFQFHVPPALPPVYRLPTSAIFHEVLENGLTRNGPIPESYTSPHKVQTQLFPVLPWLRFLIGRFQSHSQDFARKLGFHLPSCCQNDEDFMSDIMTNFPGAQFGNSKDDVIRGLCSFIRELLVEQQEEYIPSLERKFS